MIISTFNIAVGDQGPEMCNGCPLSRPKTNWWGEVTCYGIKPSEPNKVRLYATSRTVDVSGERLCEHVTNLFQEHRAYCSQDPSLPVPTVTQESTVTCERWW